MATTQPSLEALAEVLERIENGADAFAMLGLSQNAAQREVELAHRDLCVLLHPDRAIFRGKGEHTADVERATRALSQAFARIGKPAEREAYRATLLRTGQADVVDAEGRLRGIRALLAKRDFATAQQAIHDLRRQAPDVPQSEIELLLGQAVLGDTSHPLESRTAAARSLWTRVVEREIAGAYRAQAAYLLAHMRRHDGDTRDAMRWLEICLKADPNHVDGKRLERLLARSPSATGADGEISATFSAIAHKSGAFLRRVLDR